MKNNLFVLLLLIILVGCKSSYQTIAFKNNDIPAAPNYANEKSWAVLPTKYPESLKKYATKNIENLKADVFYVYPTLLMDKNDVRWNAPTDDEIQNDKVVNTAVKNQASPFATSGKIYVPFYRQAHIKSYDLYYKGGKEAFEVAYADVKNAFEYYLKYYNNNRPIIIASHSQGTNHTTQLLKDFFDEKPLQKRLIAAYIVGMGIKPKNKKVYNDAVTTNPITWDDSKSTTLHQHKGFLYSNGKLYTKALKIEITDGMVWSTNPKFPLRFFMSFMKNYHAGDINLFWQDIKENVELRTKTWFENN